MAEGNTEQNRDSAASTLEQLEALEIPPNIDPKLLELWLYREREELGHQEKPSFDAENATRSRRLTWLFAAYIGIVTMCLTVVLGMLQGKETTEILHFTCRSFLIYTVIGFFVGLIAEYCVADSVETLLREMIRRSDESAAASVADTVNSAAEGNP